MGASIPLIFTNLILYILVSRTLRKRPQSSTTARDRTLSKAFMLLSIIWIVLWSPNIVFRILYGFLEAPVQDEIFMVTQNWTDRDRQLRYFFAEFVLKQISILFSSVNSVILVVVLRPFHETLLKIWKLIRDILKKWSTFQKSSPVLFLSLLIT